MEKHLFQVNLEGILDVLSNHLYSSEQVYIRELLQNAVDAITAHRKVNPAIIGEIHIEIFKHQDSVTLSMEDNGIGLTRDEVIQFLSSIGSSTKRGYFEANRSDFIGRFGIGLLSCFMVSDNITLVTKSAKSEKAIKWVGKTDGTYELTEIDSTMSVGTKVYLMAKQGKNKLLSEATVKELVVKYGNLLNYPIYFTNVNGKSQLNSGLAPWEENELEAAAKHQAILAFGNDVFEENFKDFFEISVDDGKTKGVAFIASRAVNAGAENTHSVYLKRMLISEKIDNLLPKWAFFVRCIFNTETLQPTASRESFYEDEHLEKVSEEIGEAIRKHLFYSTAIYFGYSLECT
jgi:molecular chaperone HtpG